MAVVKKASTEADKMVDLVVVEPVKLGGKRREPGEVLGVLGSVADDLVAAGVAKLPAEGAES